MSTYKLIASDLDGTLIGTDMKLSPENRQAISQLAEKGVVFVPATGRTICEMQEVFNLPEIRYVIFSNGAGVYDKETNNTDFYGIDEDDSRFIFETLSKFDAFPIVHKDGKTYSSAEKNIEYYNLSFNVRELVEKYTSFTKNLEEQFSGEKVECLSVFFAKREDTKKCLDMLNKSPALRAVEGWDCNIEVFSTKAGKGTALKALCEKLGIDMSETVSIGDSDNDRQMTLVSGLGLAAGNACDSLKEIADGIICTNDEHIARFVLEKYFSS